MNEKITLQLLAERLPADIFGEDADSRAALVSEIFAVASEILSEGHELTVKGLGTFSPSADNPGEPVKFTPDEHFTAIVNAPFAGFHTVEITDGVSDNMLEQITVTAEDDSEDTVSEEREAEVATGFVPEPEPVPESVIPEPEPLPESHIPSPEPLPSAELPEAAPLPPAYIPEPSPLPPAYIPEPDPRVQPLIAEEDRPSDYSQSVTADDTDIPEPAEEEAPVTDTTAVIPTAPVDQPIVEQEVIPSGGPDDGEVQEEPAYDDDDESANHHQEPQSSRFGSGFFWGFLTGLLIGAIILLIYVMLTAGPSPADPYEASALDADAVETMME